MADGGPIPGAKLMVVASTAPEDEVVKSKYDQRYAMDAASAKLLKETGRRATMRLFEMLGDDEKWGAVGPRNQIALVELALNRAFGRVETNTAEAKMADSKVEIAGALPHHLRALASTLMFPEMAGAKAAKDETKPD